MPHKPPIKPGETVDRFLARVQQEHAAANGGGDGDVKLPLSIQPIGGGVGMLVDADGVPVVGDDGMPILRNVDTPGTGSAPSFASTQAAQAQAEAFQREQDRLTREFQEEQNRLTLEARAEENRLAEEAALKRGRLSTLADLIQSFVASQAQARDTLANLQPDPFRFAAVAGGIAPFGTTPQQGFQQQLQQFASAPAPVADPNASLPSIESAIQGLTGASVPLNPQVFGMAGGGTVPAPFDVMSARLVGEAGPEVMVTGPQGVTILPLGKGAQEGGFFPFQPIEFDRETLLPALGTSGIFERFGSIPRSTSRPGRSGLFAEPFARDPIGRPFSDIDLGTLRTLGIQPSLLKFDDSGTIFFRDPSTSQLRPFTSAGQFTGAGFDFGNVVHMAPETRGQFDIGAAFTGRPPISTTPPSQFTKFSVPIIEPTTGTLLPAPFTVATELNRLRLTNPPAFNLLLSAYESAVTPAGNSAGVSAESVLSSIQSSLVFGQERSAIGLR